jgi:DNA-binding protein HU-beta
MTSPKKMTKADLIASTAAAHGITKAHAGKIVDHVFDQIRAHVAAGTPVAVPGFGTFSLRKRAARTGRNPATGAPVEIAATTTLHFKASKHAA